MAISQNCDVQSLWKLYDYVNAQGQNEFRAWTEKLQKVEKVKLIQKLDMLAQMGMDLLPSLLAGPVDQHIYKMKIKGDRMLRPRLCRGPVDNDREFTLLAGAFEKQGKDVPATVNAIAIANRSAVLADPGKRRREHERVK